MTEEPTIESLLAKAKAIGIDPRILQPVIDLVAQDKHQKAKSLLVEIVTNKIKVWTNQ